MFHATLWEMKMMFSDNTTKAMLWKKRYRPMCFKLCSNEYIVCANCSGEFDIGNICDTNRYYGCL